MNDALDTDVPPLQTGEAQLARQSFLTTVFAWMFVGLGLTAGIAAYVATSNDMLAWFEENSMVFFGLLIAELALVVAISWGINRISYQVAVFLFALYAAMNGFTLSVILEVYTTASIVSAFAVAAGMFAGMAAYGYVTKRDLSGLRSILLMGLIGVLIGLVVNIIWANSVLYWFVTFAGVVVFCGLTAYDMQKLTRIGSSGLDEGTLQKASIVGALSLYLDFINLFLFLLRIFGSSR